MFGSRRAPDVWRPYFDLTEETAKAGGRMFIQAHSRALNVLMSFETRMPFDKYPVWKEIRQKSLAEQEAALRDPETRAALVASARGDDPDPRKAAGPEIRRPNYDWLLLMDTIEGPHKTVAQLAEELGMDPVDAMIEVALQHNLKVFFRQPIFNEDQDNVLEMMKHPNSVVTFSDSGAHVSQIMDSSLQTHVLSHWVREKRALTLEEAVHMLTEQPARAWGFDDRGRLKEGLAADIIIFDADRIAPLMPEVSTVSISTVGITISLAGMAMT